MKQADMERALAMARRYIDIAESTKKITNKTILSAALLAMATENNDLNRRLEKMKSKTEQEEA